MRLRKVGEFLRKSRRYYQVYGGSGLFSAAKRKFLSRLRRVDAASPVQPSRSSPSSSKQSAVMRTGQEHVRGDGRAVVLITGASRGIGYVTAQTFLNAGAQVALCAHDAVRLANAESNLRHLGHVWAQPADLRYAEQARAFVDSVLAHYGHIDVLINNAGRARGGQFVLESDAGIDEMIDVNIKGLLYTTHAALPSMLRRKSGIVINIASGAGKTGYSGLSVYSASKFAVVGFTQALASELDDHGIRVYAVCPSAVATDMIEDLTGRRDGMPAERVAQAILQLTGSNPPIKTGQCLELRRDT